VASSSFAAGAYLRHTRRDSLCSEEKRAANNSWRFLLLPLCEGQGMCHRGLALSGTRKGVGLKAAGVRWVTRHKTIVSKYRRLSKCRWSISLRRNNGVANEFVDRNFAQPKKAFLETSGNYMMTTN
jgi:hypothetical protein